MTQRSHGLYETNVKGRIVRLAKESGVEVEGVIEEVLGGDKFRIKLENGTEVQGYLSGKMRKNFIRILPADKVLVELSIYELTRGRITYRYK